MTWVKSRGARPWRAPSITATSLALLVFAAPASSLAADAVDPVGRVHGAAAAYGGLEEGLSESEIRRDCGHDALCAARRIAAASGGRASLQRVTQPDSDSIRWARSQASVTAVRRLIFQSLATSRRTGFFHPRATLQSEDNDRKVKPPGVPIVPGGLGRVNPGAASDLGKTGAASIESDAGGF